VTGARVVLLVLLMAVAGAAELEVERAEVGDAAADPARERLAELAPSWYDAPSDDWRRVDVAKPDEPREWRRSMPGVEILAYLLLAAVVAGLAALAVALWRMRVHISGEADAGDAGDAGHAARVAVLPIADEPGADDPDAALARALATGDWPAAVVWLYALALLRLDRAGVIRLAAGKTNGMYRREAGDDARASALAELVDRFERSYFGHQPVDEAVVRRLRATLERIDATPRAAP